MEITYKSRKIEKVCTIASEAEKKYGLEMAEKIHQRIDEIDASDTIEEMVQFHIGRCHPLKGNRKGQYAMDLVHPYRLVFEKIGNEIQIANVMEIVDYHKIPFHLRRYYDGEKSQFYCNTTGSNY